MQCCKCAVLKAQNRVESRPIIMDPLLTQIRGVLKSLFARACKSTDLELEYKNDLEEFGDGQVTPERIQRHLEWFLLERPSDSLGGVPLEALRQTESDAIGDEIQNAECYASMRASRAGVFLVCEVALNEGILIEDLLGRGQYAVADPLLAHLPEEEGIAIGDLVVGRIYPHHIATDGEKTSWALSPTATTIRNEALQVALNRDIQAMRARSRGPLRMSQLDLEVMFYSETIRKSDAAVSKAEPEESPLLDPSQLETNLRATLAASGIDSETVDEFVQLLRRTPMPKSKVTAGGDDPMGWIMDELAFESDVDLGKARQAITLLWQALDRAAQASVATPEGVKPEAELTSKDSLPEDSKRAEAMARFDTGREAGKDIDELFKRLEHELGIIGEEEDEEPTRVPDFPGVLGALMQEFLWDTSRAQEVTLEEQATAHKSLELFIQYGSFLGLAEELRREHIEIFLSRWLWEVAPNGGGDVDFSNLCASLSTFCQWLEEDHGHEIWKSSGELIDAAAPDLPRLAELNRTLRTAAESDAATQEAWRIFEYVGGPETEEGMDRWQTDNGYALEASAPYELRDLPLKSGDLLLGRKSENRLIGLRVYPATAAPHLKATS